MKRHNCSMWCDCDITEVADDLGYVLSRFQEAKQSIVSGSHLPCTEGKVVLLDDRDLAAIDEALNMAIERTLNEIRAKEKP